MVKSLVLETEVAADSTKTQTMTLHLAVEANASAQASSAMANNTAGDFSWNAQHVSDEISMVAMTVFASASILAIDAVIVLV